MHRLLGAYSRAGLDGHVTQDGGLQGTWLRIVWFLICLSTSIAADLRLCSTTRTPSLRACAMHFIAM